MRDIELEYAHARQQLAWLIPPTKPMTGLEPASEGLHLHHLHVRRRVSSKKPRQLARGWPALLSLHSCKS